MSKIILILFLKFLVQVSEVFATDDDLLSVVAVFRHGDRTPTDYPPNDIYQNISYWPTEPGELTNLGKNDHFKLGEWLRKRYSHFLPTTYYKDDLYVRSSNTDRCLMSAEANLAGLYPPEGNQVWNKKLSWMPVPVHTVPSEEDNLLKMGKACPQMNLKYKALLENDHFSEVDRNNSKLYEFLSGKLGMPIRKFSDIEAPYDTMTVEVLYKLKQPDWTNTLWGENQTKIFPDEMKIWSDLSYKTPTYNDELARLGTGRFFDTLTSHFEAVINNATNNLLAKKMVMFFGHKSTICDLTNVLGTFKLASYASSLLFELWRNSSSQSNYVTLYYVDNLKPEKLTIRSCGENCDFQTFQEILKPIRMNETVWESECITDGVAKISNSLVLLIIGLAVSMNLFWSN